LRCSPGAGGGEVDAEGTGGAVGGQDFGEAVAFLSRSISTLSQQRVGSEDQIAMPLPGSEL